MLKIFLVFWEFEPHCAYKRYASKKKHVFHLMIRTKISNLKQKKSASLTKKLSSINI